jgi:hypothetical protein
VQIKNSNRGVDGEMLARRAFISIEKGSSQQEAVSKVRGSLS